MGSARLTVRILCTGLVTGVAFAPAARAADGGAGMSVAPVSPAPGTDVTLRVSGCSGAAGTAVSDAFVTNARLTGTGGTLTGETRVRTSLRPGSYDVRVSCAGAVVNGSVSVPARASGQPSAPPSAPPGHASAAASPLPLAGPSAPATPASQAAPASPVAPVSPVAPASPIAPVHAGGGGTARLVPAGARAAAPGTAHAVTGLVLAGVAAVAVGLLGARRSHGAR
ncbi:hypothetical protein ABZX30_36010 [Streptomyces sp. NPDC004542]|uniref:hypothetical protein n=1 Tax=Streptomyces sp. NPDC004542 TaxID=3154281 RepID=UPI0033A6E252